MSGDLIGQTFDFFDKNYTVKRIVNEGKDAETTCDDGTLRTFPLITVLVGLGQLVYLGEGRWA